MKTDQLPCDVCVHFTHTWGLQTRYCSFLCYFEGEDPICILQEQGHKLLNAPWLLGSFLSLFSCISLILAPVTQMWFEFFMQVLLGLSGVVIVALSVLGSMGICSMFGVKSTLIIVEVIPFLVLAVHEHPKP